jgi:glycosyltransferase involved in cell wall biosynthesis
MNKISVAIITKDEERNIRECLESVKWADEIVVVDNGSTDRTKEICHAYSVRFYSEEWKGYPGQKNSAIDKTGNEWVLSLDADERVTPELRAEIFAEIKKGPAHDGYYIPRKNFFLGRWIRRCGWFPDHNLRLFRKSRGRFLEREVHERIDVKGTVGYLKNPMEHWTYRTVSDYLTRMERYSTLAAREMSREGREYHLHDALLRPPFTFLQMFLLRAGFLEGYSGFLLSVLYSFYTFLKYSKLKELREREAFQNSPADVGKRER